MCHLNIKNECKAQVNSLILLTQNGSYKKNDSKEKVSKNNCYVLFQEENCEMINCI